MKKKILITGASGLYGGNAMFLANDRFKDRFDALGVYHQHPVSWPGIATRELNLFETKEIEKLLKEFRPEVVIHSAADANIDRCEKNRADAFKINVEVPKTIAKLTADLGIRMVQFSTEAFFEGDKPFDESAEPTPFNYYGETKALAEEEVKKASKSHLIVRPNFFGWNSQDKLSLSEWVLKGLQKKEPLPLFQDVIFSPLYVETLAECLFTAIEKNVSGVLNLGGSTALSKLEFGLLIAEIFKISTENVRPTKVDESALTAKRSKRMVLSTKKLQEICPDADLSIRRGIERFKAFEVEGKLKKLKKN